MPTKNITDMQNAPIFWTNSSQFSREHTSQRILVMIDLSQASHAKAKLNLSIYMNN